MLLDPDARLRALARDRDVPLAALLQFSRPLFDAYGVDSDRAEALASGADDEAPDELLLVLETARLLWAYCALDPAEQHEGLAALETTLLPGAVRDDDRAAFHVLLAELEEQWYDLGDARHPITTPFPALLATYHAAFPPADPRDDEADALARFARPLLDDPAFDAAEDLDAFDRRMDLAHALWDAAHAEADERAALLAGLSASFPEEPDPAALLDRLLTHFHAEA